MNMFPDHKSIFFNYFHVNESTIDDNLPATAETTFLDFNFKDNLIKVGEEELKTNADFSATTSFQIEHHEGCDTISAVMCELSVQVNLTLDRNLNDEDLEFLKTMKTFF